ncbi:MAG: protein kinase, partial [Planctomycetota bacterium]
MRILRRFSSATNEALPSKRAVSEFEPAQTVDSPVLSNNSESDSQEEPSAKEFQYHCVCGQEFSVQSDQRNHCPSCDRVINGNLLQRNLSLTVSLQNFDPSDSEQEFEAGGSSASLVGESLGHFRIDQQIGRGGMGTVYRALDTSLQRYVAVKLIQRRSNSGSTHQAASDNVGSGSEDDVSDALEEAIAQARLNHPNVTTIYYVGRKGEKPFMAMELLPGGTLADQIKEGPLPYRQAIRHVLRVAYALEHAHQFDIVHADIKPSNLLLTDAGDVKLSDFGLARSATRKTATGRVSGTPNYLAPEIIDGQPASIQSDMYALGVTLFELLFGRYPFQLSGTTLLQQLSTHAVASIEYPTAWPNQIPEEVKPILDRLMAKSPDDRYPDYASLIDELETVQPISSVHAGIVPRQLAYLMDQAIVFGLMVAWSGIWVLLSGAFTSDENSGSDVMVVLGWLPILMIYFWWVRQGFRTPGRLIFQLKIVDEHGLMLSPRRRMIRESIRCGLLVALTVSSVLGLWEAAVVGIAAIAIVLINLVALVASAGERT